jgi:hypothetical protein
VVGGCFIYYLGSNVAFGDDLFTDSLRFLSIWIDGEPAEISPRTKLASVPFTYHSLRSDSASLAKSVANGSVTGDGILDGSIVLNDLAQNGAAAGQVIKWDGAAWQAADDEAGSSGGWTNVGTTVRLSTITDKVGVGTDDPYYKLHVAGTVRGDSGVSGASETYSGVHGTALLEGNEGAGVQGDGLYTDGVYGETHSGSHAGVHGVAGEYSNGTGVLGEGVASTAGVKGVNVYSDAVGVYGNVTGDNSKGVYAVTSGENGWGVYANAIGSGSAGVYTQSSDSRAVYAKAWGSTAALEARNENAVDGGAGVYGVGLSNNGVYGGTASSNIDHAGVYGKNNGAGSGVYGYASLIGVEGEGNSYGVYGKALLDGGVAGNFLTMTDKIGCYGIHSVAPGDQGIGIYAEGGPNGYGAIFRGNVQILSQSSGVLVMELGEGLDYAEGFDISNDVNYEPGTVLVIDLDNPGELTISSEAYDSRVAGIIAGANGLGSGVKLGSGEFDVDVALAGRVYCSVDARYGAIKPGDLLTTSPTPGHAMIARDYTQAQGAIIGKAMEALADGETGQILVLVTLQ